MGTAWHVCASRQPRALAMPSVPVRPHALQAMPSLPRAAVPASLPHTLVRPNSTWHPCHRMRSYQKRSHAPPDTPSDRPTQRCSDSPHKQRPPVAQWHGTLRLAPPHTIESLAPCTFIQRCGRPRVRIHPDQATHRSARSAPIVTHRACIYRHHSCCFARLKSTHLIFCPASIAHHRIRRSRGPS